MATFTWSMASNPNPIGVANADLPSIGVAVAYEHVPPEVVEDPYAFASKPPTNFAQHDVGIVIENTDKDLVVKKNSKALLTKIVFISGDGEAPIQGRKGLRTVLAATFNAIECFDYGDAILVPRKLKRH